MAPFSNDYFHFVRVSVLLREMRRWRLFEDGIRFTPPRPHPVVLLALSEGVGRLFSGGSCGTQSAFVFDGSTWIRSLFMCLQIGSFWSKLHFFVKYINFSSTMAVIVLVHWSYRDLARWLPDCLPQQVLPGTREGGLMTAACLRLASVLVVVAR